MRRAAAWGWPLAFLAGVAVQLQQARLWPVELYGLVLATGAFAFLLAWAGFKRQRVWAAWFWACFAFAVVGFGATGGRAGIYAQTVLNEALQGQDIDVVGTVAAMPHRHPAGLRFRLNVESAQIGGQPVQLPKMIDLGWYAGFSLSTNAAQTQALLDLQRQTADLRAGERWQMRVRLKTPHGQRNPSGFDFELWLWEQGVGASGYVRAGSRDPAPERLLPGPWSAAMAIERARQSTRDAIFARVTDPRAAGVLAALVVGDQRAIERADWDVFRATGVAHLMSISGLHVTMFAWVAAAFVGGLWRRSARYSPRLCHALPAPMAAALGGWLLALAYALFSGWGVPAQRTVWMLAVVLATRLVGVRWPWPLVWLLAALVVVVVDPWALMQAGFWLSFVAVGVLFASEQTTMKPNSTPEYVATNPIDSETNGINGIKNRLLSSFSRMAKEQGVIGLALAPLSLLLFGQVSVVGLLANLVAIPWVTFIVTPLAMLGALVPLAWDLGALGVQVLHGLLVWASQLPGGVWQVAVAPLPVALLGCAGGLWVALPGPFWLRALGLPLILPVLMWSAPRPDAGQFEVVALDVGQGSAVVVRTHGHTLLYDAGPAYSLEADAGQRVVVPYLRSLNESPDRVVLSHRDIDHTGGANAVLSAYPNASVFSSLEATHPLLQSSTVAIRHTRCVAGQRWSWDGVDFEVLHPQAHAFDRPSKSNALSCVLRVSNGLKTALLPGDIESTEEAELVNTQPGQLRADVLLVPHHGSQTSSTEAFLQAVQPRVALTQAGYRNRFGHPAASVVGRYQLAGVPMWVSPTCGAQTWASANSQVVCERERNVRYWHWR